MSEEKNKTEPQLLTEKEVSMGLNFLNILYNAAIVNLPSGMVPAAAAAQQEGLREAGQGLVDLIEAHGPMAEERAKQMREAFNPPKTEANG
jgi:hypothetical protein